MVNLQRRSSSSGSSSPAADRMVKIEMEAAEALAGLAEGAAETGAGKWGGKGKRAMKRVKGESPPPPPQTGLDSVVDRSVEDRPAVYPNQLDDSRRSETEQATNFEQKGRLRRPCSTSHLSFGGGRSRQNLTEAEREARKIRRILANRESARQTIRRRQALCEELAKKAADLSDENQKLKREKELALKEYQSLETTNRNLKVQVAEATKAEVEAVEGNRGEAMSGQGDKPTSPKNCPLFLYDRPPLTPLFWPAMVQSSNPFPSQHEPQNQNPPILPPNVPVATTTTKYEGSNKQENHVNMSGPITPIYLLPCPWFFPIPDHSQGLPQPFFCANNKQEENSVSNRGSACTSSKNVANLELNNKVEDSGSMEARPVNDLNEPMVEFSQNGGDSSNKARSEHTFLSLAPASFSSLQPTITNNNAESEAISSTASRNLSPLPEQKQEQDPHLNLKSMEAFAAAEARRRRKELTKLKSIHIRHNSRMHG